MPTCFVIQPFDDENDKRYRDVYKPALEEAGVVPYRVDEDASVAVPIDSIEAKIRESDICLADITTHNPNVWYELGFAFATGLPVIMTCEGAAFGKLPFDVQHRFVIKYSTGSPSDFRELGEEVVRRVQARLKEAREKSVSRGGRDAGESSHWELSDEAKQVLSKMQSDSTGNGIFVDVTGIGDTAYCLASTFSDIQIKTTRRVMAELQAKGAVTIKKEVKSRFGSTTYITLTHIGWTLDAETRKEE